MKKAMLITVLVLAVTFGGSALYAQANSSPGQGGEQWGGHGPAMSPEQRLQHMTKQLNLTDDQQQKIKPILEDEAQQMQTLHQDSSLSPQDVHSKMQQIRQNTMTQIKPILNADQQKKLEEMSSHQGHRGGWGQNQNAPQ